MMTPYAQEANAKKNRDEFLDKLSHLITEYRKVVSTGEMIGAVEVIKLKLFLQANETAEAIVAKEEKGHE